MNTQYLKEFITLAQTGSFLETAELLDSSQSTLSKHIKNLETELGISLFDRTTRKVAISLHGKLFLPYAQEIVDLHDQYTISVKESLETDLDIVNLGTIPALAEYNITDVLVNFKKSRQGATINVMQEGSAGLKEMLRQKRCELAFIRFTEEGDADLIKIPFAVDTLAAVLPLSHPLAKKKTITLQMLENEDLILSDKQTMLYKLSVSACQKSGFEPKVTYTDHKYENIVDFVIKGLGVALIMKKLALHVSNRNAVIIDITPSVTTQINLCYMKDSKLSDAARHLIRCAAVQKS